MEKATVHGIRICKVCGGICHEGAYRTAWGSRRTYFCCEEHAWGHYQDKWYQILEKQGVLNPWSNPKFDYTDETWAEDKEFYLEPVDVKTA